MKKKRLLNILRWAVLALAVWHCQIWSTSGNDAKRLYAFVPLYVYLFLIPALHIWYHNVRER